MLAPMRWVFTRDTEDGSWRARRYPPADPNRLAAAETLAREMTSRGKLERFIDDWIRGSAENPGYAAGTEAVRLTLADSAIVVIQDVYGQFHDTQLSRTDFRAMLDGLWHAIDADQPTAQSESQFNA